MLRPRLRIPRAGALFRQSTLSARSLHIVPKLDQFKQDEAVPGLLSPAGYHMAWTEYQQHITDKLNNMTAGTDFEHQDTLPILKSTARDASQAATFNYASMAYNNHFFFQQLANLQTLYEQKAQAQSTRQAETADPQGEDAAAPEQVEIDSSEARIPPKLKQELELNFSSIETLRREFLTTAMGMFGPGFVWLVKNANTQDLRILTTYLAGSPFTAAHWRRQGTDFNTTFGDASTVNSYLERSQTGAGNTSGRFSPQAPGGTDVVPLLCLNTWEHVWLTDYGVRGKGEYVQHWWESIDWDKVENLAIPKRKFK